MALMAALLIGAGACAPESEGNTGGEAGDAATQLIEVPGLDDPQRLMELAQGVPSGSADAPVTILEFADYSCPHCRTFQQQVKPRIEMTYVQDGRAQLVFHDFVLGGFPHSFLAARAARCAGDQQKYWQYHDVLFLNQATWSTRAAAPVAALVSYAEQIGADASVFESCLRSDQHAEVVSANRKLAEQLNLPSTSSVLVGVRGGLPVRIDNSEWTNIAAVVDSLLASVRPGGGS
jgi:protein-disulfide isomerase